MWTISIILCCVLLTREGLCQPSNVPPGTEPLVSGSFIPPLPPGPVHPPTPPIVLPGPVHPPMPPIIPPGPVHPPMPPILPPGPVHPPMPPILPPGPVHPPMPPILPPGPIHPPIPPILPPWSIQPPIIPPLPTITTKPQIPKCYNDIVFSLDMSGSIGEHNFKDMLDKCKEMVYAYTVGPFATLFGLDVFSTRAKTKIKLKDYTDQDSLIDAIDDVEYEGGLTNTYKALYRLINKSFSISYGHRPPAQMTVVLMTDGRSQAKQKTINAAKAVKKAGIRVFVIAIGKNIDWEEIIAIATAKSYAFKVSSFKALKSFDVKQIVGLSSC